MPTTYAPGWRRRTSAAFAPQPQPTSRMRACGRAASTCLASTSRITAFGRSMYAYDVRSRSSGWAVEAWATIPDPVTDLLDLAKQILAPEQGLRDMRQTNAGAEPASVHAHADPAEH